MSIFAYATYGIYNTETSIVPEKSKVLRLFSKEKQHLLEELRAYKKTLEESNEKLKISIVELKILIELKKDTLIKLKNISDNNIKKKELKR